MEIKIASKTKGKWGKEQDSKLDEALKSKLSEAVYETFSWVKIPDGMRVVSKEIGMNITFVLRKGVIRIIGRSFMGGPGAHAAVVSIIKDFGKRRSLEWLDLEKSANTVDPTGYFFNEDYEGLTAFYLRLLREDIQNINWKKVDTKYPISLYVGGWFFPSVSRHQVIAPIGGTTRTNVKAALKSEKKLRELGEIIWVWTEKDFGLEGVYKLMRQHQFTYFSKHFEEDHLKWFLKEFAEKIDHALNIDSKAALPVKVFAEVLENILYENEDALLEELEEQYVRIKDNPDLGLLKINSLRDEIEMDLVLNNNVVFRVPTNAVTEAEDDARHLVFEGHSFYIKISHIQDPLGFPEEKGEIYDGFSRYKPGDAEELKLSNGLIGWEYVEENLHDDGEGTHLYKSFLCSEGVAIGLTSICLEKDIEKYKRIVRDTKIISKDNFVYRDK